MPTDEDFKQQIMADPGEVYRWLFWADWLEETGRGGQAEILRLRTELTQQIEVPHRVAKEARALELLYGQGILPPVVQIFNSIGMEFILIPPGEFLMGAPPEEIGRYSDESQVHIKLTKPFYIAKYTLSEREYEKISLNKSSIRKFPYTPPQKNNDIGKSNFPITQIGPGSMHGFYYNLTQKEQKLGLLPASMSYSLPTEAQWEYTCRSGISTAFHFGSDFNPNLANSDFSTMETTPRGTYLPNLFGIEDSQGNVSELCLDYYNESRVDAVDPLYLDGQMMVSRGGNWASPWEHARSAYRGRKFDLLYQRNLGAYLSENLENAYGCRICLIFEPFRYPKFANSFDGLEFI